MMKLNFVTLENGIDYMIMDEKEFNNVKYIYLVNEEDSSDFCIRKVVTEYGEEMLSGLDNDDEFQVAVNLFNK